MASISFYCLRVDDFGLYSTLADISKDWRFETENLKDFDIEY